MNNGRVFKFSMPPTLAKCRHRHWRNAANVQHFDMISLDLQKMATIIFCSQCHLRAFSPLPSPPFLSLSSPFSFLPPPPSLSLALPLSPLLLFSLPPPPPSLLLSLSLSPLLLPLISLTTISTRCCPFVLFQYFYLHTSAWTSTGKVSPFSSIHWQVKYTHLRVRLPPPPPPAPGPFTSHVVLLPPPLPGFLEYCHLLVLTSNNVWKICWIWTKRYLITTETRVNRISRIHHQT